jgi:hypothetical protein
MFFSPWGLTDFFLFKETGFHSNLFVRNSCEKNQSISGVLPGVVS